MLNDLQLILDLLNLLLDLLDLLPGLLLHKLAKDVGLLLDLVTLGRGQSTLGKYTVQANKLLGDPIVVRAQLVEDTDIVLSIGLLSSVGKALSLLLDLRGNISDDSTTSDLGHEGVQRLDSASNGVETTTDDTVGAGLLVDPVNKSLLAATTLVGDSLLATGGEPLEGRVGLDTLLLSNSLTVGCLSVDLGDQDVLVIDEGVGEVLPGRSEGLAVWHGQQLAKYKGIFKCGETHVHTREQ